MTVINKGLISVAGEKGGTGKTFFTVNLSISLANMGHNFIVIDGDFGGPDVHNFLSIEKPNSSLKTRNINLIPIIQPLTVSARKHLQIDLEYLGNVRFDSNIEKSLENKEIFILNYPHSGASKDIFNISSNNFSPKSAVHKKISRLIKRFQKTSQ